MKKYAMLALATVLMFSLSIMAQEQQPAPKGERGAGKEFRQGGQRMSIEERVAKMATDLSLTDTEKASVKTLMEKQEVANQKFRSENDRESPDFRTKFKEFRTAQDAELKAVIGEEKFQKLQTMRAEQRQKMEKKPE